MTINLLSYEVITPISRLDHAATARESKGSDQSRCGSSAADAQFWEESSSNEQQNPYRVKVE